MPLLGECSKDRLTCGRAVLGRMFGPPVIATSLRENLSA
jgi:hypothetical protein